MPTSVPEGTWGGKRGEAKASSPTHYLLLNSPNLGGDNEGTGVFCFLPSSPLQILLAKPFSGTSLFRNKASVNQPIQVKPTLLSLFVLDWTQWGFLLPGCISS